MGDQIMKRRKTSVATAAAIAVKPASNVHRKHPVSIAVSLALLAAAATSAMAAEPAGAPAEAAGAEGPAQSGTGSAATDEGPKKSQTETVTVTGVRVSQERAIEVKRLAPSIQDSISAESIGQLPDTTITDALQRITGVQINRDGGVGTSVDVRGLPQVGTMLNGEVFITPDQIDSQQPDFTTLPATLFNQVDVIKSPTSAQTTTGISGAIDLHTYRPWDLPSGFTYAYSLNGEKGDVTKKTGKEGHGLIAYNGDGRWGLQLSADYADTTLSGARDTDGNGNPGPASEGLDQYGVIFHPRSRCFQTAVSMSTATASPTAYSWAARISASTTSPRSASASPPTRRFSSTLAAGSLSPVITFTRTRMSGIATSASSSIPPTGKARPTCH